MSRAFVINGDEWGYCIKMSRKCSGADPEGKCMRNDCSEVPEWEKPKRSLEELRREKMEEALKEAEAARKTAELREKIAAAKILAAKRREERAAAEKKVAPKPGKQAVHTNSQTKKKIT